MWYICVIYMHYICVLYIYVCVCVLYMYMCYPYICFNILYWCFSFWLTSPCIIGSSFIHFIRMDWNAFFFIAKWYPIVYMYHNFLIHSSANGHLGCFHVLACKQCCNKQWSTYVSFNSGLLSVYAQLWDCWVVWQFCLQFFNESPYCSP